MIESSLYQIIIFAFFTFSPKWSSNFKKDFYTFSVFFCLRRACTSLQLSQLLPDERGISQDENWAATYQNTLSCWYGSEEGGHHEGWRFVRVSLYRLQKGGWLTWQHLRWCRWQKIVLVQGHFFEGFHSVGYDGTPFTFTSWIILVTIDSIEFIAFFLRNRMRGTVSNTLEKSQ